MNALLRDIRYGFRSLRQSPALAIVATIALTVGIALTTTMFSILYGALMKGLPFEDGNRIVMVQRANPMNGSSRMSVTVNEYFDYKAQQHSIDDLAASSSGTFNVSGTDKPERYDGTWITANGFNVLRVRPVLGRALLPGDDTPSEEKVAVLSYDMWQSRYAGSRDVLGQTIRANGMPYTVVGVMPRGFAFPNNAKLWLPLQMDPFKTKRSESSEVEVFGRLKAGVTIDGASSDFAAIAARLAKDYKESNENITAGVHGYVDAAMGPQPRQLLYTMLGAVFFVLLIACANVANLLLDRAAHKTKEVGIRTALGASRTAVIRQFLTEALALVAHRDRPRPDHRPFLDRRIQSRDHRHEPALLHRHPAAPAGARVHGRCRGADDAPLRSDPRLPVVARRHQRDPQGRLARRVELQDRQDQQGPRRVRDRAVLRLLLVAAGLMIKSVTRLKTMDMGFNQENVFTARMGFPAAYTDTVAQMQFYEQLLQRVAAIPGVKSAMITAGLPAGDRSFGGSNFAVEGKAYPTEKDYPNTRTVAVTPDFFATLEIPARGGRLFNSGDRPASLPVAVVNDAFVKKFFPGADPIGHRVRMGGPKSTDPWLTIVGVVGDVFAGDPEHPKPEVVYRPLLQNHSNFVYVAARTTGTPMRITSDVRNAVTSLNPDIPIYWVYSLKEAVARPTWFIRVFGTMFMIFGVIALFLASIGLYAVMSFSVSRRTREVGIRMALGARGQDVVGMIFRQGALQLTIGMIVGLALAMGVSQLMTIILFDVQPRDPVIFTGVAVVLVAVGLMACLIPARRATRVDPLVALRSE